MKNVIKRIEAFLLAILFVLNISPVSVLAESGEYSGGQLGLGSNPRPHYIDIDLEDGQESITLQAICEAAGESGWQDMEMSPDDPLYTSEDGQTLLGLGDLTDSASMWIWDNAAGEWAICVTFIPANAAEPRPHYITIQLDDDQDSVTLEYVAGLAGEAYTNDLIFYYPDPNTMKLSSDYQTISNLTSLTGGQQGKVWVYDYAGGDDAWAIHVTFIPPVEKKYYAVTETVTVSLAEILDAAGVTVSTYDNYYLIQDDSSADYSAVSPSNLDHTVTFNSTDLPEAGLRYRLNANGGEPCPFKLVFIGDNAPQNANDGIFTYALDQANGTATVTGFVSGLSDADKANITIPASMTWPKNGETEYTVTGIADSAFSGNTAIKTVTVAATNLNVGDHAFENCSALTSFSDPNAGGVLTVGEYAFSGCTALKTFSSDAGIDRIKDKAFFNTYRLESFTAGANKKTEIVSYSWGYSNAFQRCSGVLEFKGGISRIPPYTFHEATVSKVITTSLENSQSSSLSTANSPIDLELNVSRIDNGTLTGSVLTDDLLKYASGFKNITVNLEQGVTAVSANAFSSFPFGSYESLTVNVDTEESDARITVAEGAVPADQPKLQVNFRVPRENVDGADTDPLPALEAAGQVTYLTEAPVDNRLHDDLYWYETENGKAYIVGIYDGSATELLFTGASQGSVYTADGTLLENVSLNVAGITSLSDEEKANITSVTINSNKAFTVADGALSNMPALETLTLSNGNADLPEGAFAGCTALETVVIGTSENQSGTAAIPAGAFDGCTALTSFTCNLSVSEVASGAFDGCTALDTVSFTGKGSQVIESGAFADAAGIRYLRIDNPYNMENGAFAVSGGTTFVQNNDTALNDNLAAKIGVFENYVFTGYPWWMNNNAFSGNNAPERIYLKFTDGDYADYVVNAIRNAGGNLTDVYMDCAREDVAFADDLDEANPNVTIHYRVNHITTGCYIDGVNGNDENDGSHDAPVKTFERAKEVIAAMPAEATEVADETMDGILADACPKVGVNAAPGTFTDIIEPAPQAFVLNTVTVSGTETWDSGEGDPVILIRDPSFTGALVDVTGSLTLKNVVLDGNRTNVTATASLVNAESGSTLTLDNGAVLQNNAYPVANQITTNTFEWVNGGAVFAKNATVNIKNGSLIDNNLAMYGGGVQMYGGTLNMTGGTVSNNTAQARRYTTPYNGPVQGNGGGILLTHGAVMNMSGGTVTGNYAKGYEYNPTIGVNGSTGGGIQVGASMNDLNSNAQLFMTGGVVSNNHAHAEGGGICIQDSCTGTITAGRIINNESLVDGGYVDSFGGGGIYVNAARAGTRNGLLKLNNALITDNEAYSGGGGIACCETVNLTLAMGNGAAIYGNHITGRGGEHDLLLFYRGYGSSPGTKAKLAFYMMNGAEYNWTHVVTQYDKEVDDCPFDNGAPVSEELIAYVNVGSIHCDLKLKSNPTNTSVNPKVIITGNKANARGGGIGSNGNIVIGDLPPAGDVTMTPDISKLVVGRDMKEGEEYTFSVILEEGVEAYQYINGKRHVVTTYTDTPVGTGTVTGAKDNTAAKVSLPGYTLSNVNEGKLGSKYVLLVLEDTADSDVLDADDGVYFAQHFIIGQGKDSTGKSCYKAYLYKTEKGAYTRNDDGSVDLEYGTFTVPGYAYPYVQRIRSEITGDPVFTNYPLEREASAEKLWQDEAGNSITPVDGVTVTFELLADGQTAKDTEGNDVLPVTLDGTVDETGEDAAWKAVWKNLPVFSDADHTVRIVYTVKETACSSDIYICADEEVEVPGSESAQIVNVYYETEATVIKVWDDADDHDGKRPESLKVTLSNGTEVTLNDGNDWTATVEHLPKYKNGVEITYTWTEDALPDGYTLTGTGIEGTVTTLTNSHTPEETEATVKKVWDDADDRDGKRPGTLKVTLSNGAEVTLSESNSWTATVEHLPKYKDHGTEITYTWTEDALPEGYTLTNTGTEGTVTTLTNSYTPEETEATVVKVWDDMDNLDNIRPVSLTVTLSNGTDVVLNKDNEWKATVTGLPKYKDHGTEIAYTWTEKDLPDGYRLKSTKAEGTVTTLTNTHNTSLLVSTSVSKVWNDEDNRDGSRPETLTVTLLVNGEASQKFVLSEENNWYAEVTNLDRLDETGKLITYSWKEEAVPGYVDTTIVNGTHTEFINTHKPEMTSVTVVKIWDDKDDALEKRPVSIVMTLNNGMTVTLNERNHWKATISNLPTYDHGKKIEYSWTEQKVLDYVQTDKTVKGNTTYFTNALYSTPDEPPPGKPPKNPGPPTVYIPEYDTPLGVEVPVNHVGDCFD